MKKSLIRSQNVLNFGYALFLALRERKVDSNQKMCIRDREQEAAKRRELEQQLYEVFRKYADKRQSEEAGA